jgi:hypothetical protein
MMFAALFGLSMDYEVFLLAGAMVLSLAPAMLTLFGAGVWWLPRWLSRVLPHVDIEGEEPPATEPDLDLQPWLAGNDGSGATSSSSFVGAELSWGLIGPGRRFLPPGGRPSRRAPPNR